SDPKCSSRVLGGSVANVGGWDGLVLHQESECNDPADGKRDDEEDDSPRLSKGAHCSVRHCRMRQVPGSGAEQRSCAPRMRRRIAIASSLKGISRDFPFLGVPTTPRTADRRTMSRPATRSTSSHRSPSSSPCRSPVRSASKIMARQSASALVTELHEHHCAYGCGEAEQGR